MRFDTVWLCCGFAVDSFLLWGWYDIDYYGLVCLDLWCEVVGFLF